ncbi:MAG: ATP-binding cassette domain-containing protein [Phycisphaeraceae bacterium]|nr:ATP-binding cassette domain-containing protein [Phycisphaerales bacterium]MCB9841780.1 ATP-binding cassette domain-containing protein [Phycisphaeraceae bacterium]
MPLLAATNLKHAFGTDIILDGVSLSIESGERVGLVGRNGQGKSTLMKALTGLLKPDSGEVVVQRGCRAGYLHQDPNLNREETLRDAAEGAFAELHSLHQQLHAVYDQMAEASDAQLDKLLRKQEELERKIEAAGGYAIDHKIDETLHGLGFTDAQFSIKVKDLSGGQKGRLALAKLLLESPDILLLDEPTNHLDIAGRLWLEDFLKNDFRGAVLLVSHDRRLLDNVVTRIVEVEQGRLIDYPGNYAKFRELRAERREVQLRAWESQQTKWRQEQAFIDKYRAGQRAKQAKGRESRLQRARTDDALERPVELSNLDFEFPRAERSGEIVAVARGLSKSYPNDDGTTKVLFNDLDITIARGERWGIIGPNGAGKSTLVRCVLGETKPDAGTVRLGSNVVVGHYKQTHEGLDHSLNVFRYLQKVIIEENPGQMLSEQQARNLAGAFLFSGSEQEKELGVLSGGERSRAVLAGLLASAKNVLVLDEPTNHLDISSSERLEEALALPKKADSFESGDENKRTSAFDGTLILISHDRALIDACCNHLLVLDGNGNAEVFLGNYTQWHDRELERARERKRAEDSAKSRQAADERAAKEQAEREAQQRQKPKPNKSNAASGGSGSELERMNTSQLEKRIEQIENRIAEIDKSMADPDVWADARKCAKLGDERTRLVRELEPLEFEWMRRAEPA